jgi:hypothetical protein
MSKLHLVFGGRVKILAASTSSISRASTWSAFTTAMPRRRTRGAGRAQRTVDDAEMKYVVVHLHRLLEPDGEAAEPATPRRTLTFRRRGSATEARASAAKGPPGSRRCGGGAKQNALLLRHPVHQQLDYDPRRQAARRR